MSSGDAQRSISGNRFSLRILAGVAAGAALGLLIGERTAALEPVADGYIKLLQMTVLPYVTVSIIGGLGALSPTEGRVLIKRLGIVLLIVWTLALAAVCLFPLMFPPNQNASFFSTALLEERESFDFLGLYIPANPFYSLANNVVPAVVLFSLMVGAGLIAVPDKTRLLDVLAVAGTAIANATRVIISLTPYGVFAISAVAAGTLSLEELGRLRVYLLTYVGMSLFLSLWVLPGLVATLTPVPYRVLLGRTRDALVMAFMTTSLFAVLPMLTEQVKAMVREYGGDKAGTGAETDVIVPASFNFPHTGKLLSLSFLPFAAWFVDAPLRLDQYPQLAGTGLLAMFGNVNASIPFLLDVLRIPGDTFRLFITSGVLNARFGTLLAAVHTLTVAVLATCSMAGLLTVDARKLARFVAVTLLLGGILVGGTRVILERLVPGTYDKDAILTNLRPLRDRGPASVYGEAMPAPPLPPAAGSVLSRVRERGLLRVGYFTDSLPYAFVNRSGLVGFDVEMAHQLARDLGVGLELVLLDRAILDAGVSAESCDVIMSGVAVTADRAGRLTFSRPYLDETVAFIVPDHRAAAFSDWSSIRAMGRLRIGVPNAPYYIQKVRDELEAVVIVPMAGMDDMFGASAPVVDAFIATAERGSAYTLLHPEYSVAVPKPRPFKVPLAYIVAGRDAEMLSMIDTWIELKRKDGTIDALFAHWILGSDSDRKAPRWSVLRDVLHWVD